MSERQRFAGVWDALEDTPEASTTMRLKSELVMALHDAVRGWAVPDVEVARRLDIAPGRFDGLREGELDEFSLDDLITLADRAGLSVHLAVAPAA